MTSLLAIYDGRHRLGALLERSGEVELRDADGRVLGTFPSRRAALAVLPSPGGQASSSSAKLRARA